jgi:mRNA interferase RelE/StbE
MKVTLSPRANKQLKKLSKIDQLAVAKKIRSLKSVTSQKEKLKGFKNIFRIRVGVYRIVYKKTREEIYIILIRHRRDVYRLIKQLLG